MYTKQAPPEHRRIIIPENYRGNAFNEKKEEDKSDEEKPLDELKNEEKKDTRELPAFLSTILPPRVTKNRGLFQNVGIEELLIVGTIIVLLLSDADEDIILLLFLLLFY